MNLRLKFHPDGVFQLGRGEFHRWKVHDTRRIDLLWTTGPATAATFDSTWSSFKEAVDKPRVFRKAK